MNGSPLPEVECTSSKTSHVSTMPHSTFARRASYDRGVFVGRNTRFRFSSLKRTLCAWARGFAIGTNVTLPLSNIGFPDCNSLIIDPIALGPHTSSPCIAPKIRIFGPFFSAENVCAWIIRLPQRVAEQEIEPRRDAEHRG